MNPYHQIIFDAFNVLKWFVVPTLPINFIGLVYTLLYVKEFTLFSGFMLYGAVSGTVLGFYLLFRWNHYKVSKNVR